MGWAVLLPLTLGCAALMLGCAVVMLGCAVLMLGCAVGSPLEPGS